MTWLLLLLGCQGDTPDCADYEQRWRTRLQGCLSLQPAIEPPSCTPVNLEKRLCEVGCIEAAECSTLVFYGPPPVDEDYRLCVVGCYLESIGAVEE